MKPKFEAEDLIRQAIERHKPNIYVAWSGGRCSTAVLIMAMKYWPGIPAMWNNTGVEFTENTEFIRKFTKQFNVNIIETRPETTFWGIVKKHGIPDFKTGKNRPKCCYHLKEKPAKKVVKHYGFKALITGLRAEESYTRRRFFRFCGQRYFDKTWKVFKYHPIAYWTEKQIMDYLNKNDCPENEVYTKWGGVYQRNGCIPCTSYKNWNKKLPVSHPLLYEHIQKLKGQSLITSEFYVDKNTTKEKGRRA